VFEQDQPQHRGDEDLPVWDDALPQRLLYDLCDSSHPTVATFGAAGMAALEQKAAEIHRTAVDGYEAGTLFADVEQTTWDAAETIAWLGKSAHNEPVSIPHRDADATVPDRPSIRGAAFWRLDNGDLVRREEYDSVAMRRDIAEGIDVQGQRIRGTEEIPGFALRLGEAAVDYIWTVQGRSSRQPQEAESTQPAN
jgi:hypothetical protein